MRPVRTCTSDGCGPSERYRDSQNAILPRLGAREKVWLRKDMPHRYRWLQQDVFGYTIMIAVAGI